ncbi:MAG TPA: type II toxin-antitoxin system VapC family toxin [Thermodesulfobacteriota bacterium]|nr:type II toxin-antitoxin system VapC family toxin [Thermodesulfobacteriota bacterium]
MEDQLIIVDTDVVIDFFNGVSPGAGVMLRLISKQEVALTSISVFELYAGIEGKRRLAQIETLIQSVTILPLDVIEAVIAGKIYTQLKSTGQLIGTHDILIAAVCVANTLPLYTKNVAHFSKIEGIQVLSTEELIKH